jgi:hypothetical protein
MEQGQVLPEFGIELRDLRQILVVHLAQFRTVEHRMQMRHLAPGARQTFIRIVHRLDKCGPGGGRCRVGGEGGGGPALRQQFINRHGDVFGFDLAVTRQTGKIEQGVHQQVFLNVIGRVAVVGSTAVGVN